MNCFVVLFLVFAIYVVSSNGSLPDYITTCSRSDPKLNECALRHAKTAASKFANGDPSKGLDKLDPLFIKEARSGGSGNGPGLKILLKDCVLTGVSSLEPKKINIDLKKKKFVVNLLGDLHLEAKYDISGRILIIPLNGNGRAHIGIRDVKVQYSFDFDIVTKKDGKEHVKLLSDDIKYDIGKANIKLDNLFNGDKVLGETTNRLLNEAWRDVMAELAPPVVKELKIQITKVVKKLVSLAPYDDIFRP